MCIFIKYTFNKTLSSPTGKLTQASVQKMKQYQILTTQHLVNTQIKSIAQSILNNREMDCLSCFGGIF